MIPLACSFERREKRGLFRGFAWLVSGLASLGVCTRSISAADPGDAAAELASFQIADGFQANLFASEQDGVVKPIQIRFDAKGRLWVIGSTVYPQIEPGQIPNDKVLILEDINGDGRCDRTTVFADGLLIPTGIELGDGGAYVGHGTELLFLKDTNGDGKADERRVLFRGFGTGDNHQNINSFRWGPGGELWMCQGLHIRSHVETPWGVVQLNQAGLWRFRPKRMQLEGFFGSEYEPQNPWGYVFTDWGEPIVLAGNNSSPIYPVPGLTSAHRSEAPPLIWPTGRGRKVSGGEIVGTRHFPDDWQGALILGGYINNAVWSVKILDDVAGFRFEDRSPLLTSTNQSFRPVDVRFGPDGALYICDWFNPIIGHYQASFRHPDRDKKHGRIWRVTAKDRPLIKSPNLHNATIPQLLDQLKSTDRWARQFAKRVLADRLEKDVTAELTRWTQEPSLSDQALVEALGVYQSHEVVAPELLRRLAHAETPGARGYAASVAGSWADRLPETIALLRVLVRDAHPRVRLQAVVACSYVRSAEAMEVAAMAADFPTDKFLDYALHQTVFALKSSWLPAFQSGTLNLENKFSRVAALVGADGTPDTIEAVRRLWRAAPRSSSARETFVRLLIDIGNARDFSEILEMPDPAIQARVLPALHQAAARRKIRPDGDVASALKPIVESSDRALRAEGLKLAGLWKIQAFQAKADAWAKDNAAGAPTRRAAIEALALFGDPGSRATLLFLAESGTSAARAAAIPALATFDLAQAANQAAAFLSQQDVASDEVAEILSALLQRSGGANFLTTALRAQPPSRAAAGFALPVFNASGRNLPELAKIFSTAAGSRAEEKKMSIEQVAEFVQEVKTSGDAARGAQVFRRTDLGCVACHTVNGTGGRVGPELSALGTAQPIDFIVGAILDPQKEVKEGFTAILISTKEGDEHLGYVTRESANEIVLRDALNQEVRIARSDVSERKQIGSLMPSGLADGLTRSEFRDLVRYLSELGKSNERR